MSKIAQLIPDSPIRKLVPYALDAKKRGINVHHLNIGNPDIKTPEAMIKVLHSWDKNPVGYSDSHGEPALVESLLSYYQLLGHSFLNNANIQVTLGGSEGLLWTFLSICDVGDEILTFEPFYTNYLSLAIMAHAKLVGVPRHIKDGFHLPSVAEIESKITKKTKALLFCNPCNPTGIVYSKSEIEMLVKLAKKHNLYLISDEVYREFSYSDQKVISLLDYAQEMPNQIIMVDSLSKRYSVCGARLGCIVSLNNEFMSSCLCYAQARLSAGFVDQIMASALRDVPQDYFDNIVSEYNARREALVNGLKKIPNVICSVPEGAFYVVAKLPVSDAEHFATWLLTDFEYEGETVMVAPAEGFYVTPGLGKDQVRIAYVLHIDKLKRSIEILRRALVEYQEINTNVPAFY